MSPVKVIVSAKQTAKGPFEIDDIPSPVAGLEELVGKSYPNEVAVQDAFVCCQRVIDRGAKRGAAFDFVRLT